MCCRYMTKRIRERSDRARGANKELWLLSLFVIALLSNFVVVAQRMVLAPYTLPTLQPLPSRDGR